MKRRIFYHSILMLLAGPLLAQQTDISVKIPEVQIIDSLREKVPSGFQETLLDSVALEARRSESLGTLLNEESGIHIRQYAPGGLSSINLRGTTPQHTKLYWNDIPLNSAMHGQTDMNLHPVYDISEVKVKYGGNSLYQTGGGLGGSIQLLSGPDWANRQDISLLQEAGSFGSYSGGLKAALGGKKWQSHTSGFLRKAENDYTYTNVLKFDAPEEKQEHAAFFQYALGQELYGRVGKYQVLSAKTRYTFTDREIPPALLSVDAKERQEDHLWLNSLGWEYQKGKDRLHLSTNYKYEQIHYRNQLAQLDELSKARAFVNRVDYRHRWSRKLDASIRLDQQLNWAEVPSYLQVQHQHIHGAAVSANYAPYRFLALGTVIRQELADEMWSPFLPSVGAKLTPFRKQDMDLSANVYRNYRYPTLNDLYWAPGGNPDLKPETSYGGELTTSFSRKWREKGQFSTSITGFYTVVDDWIVWEPSSLGYWQPNNVRKVLSRGIELLAKINAQLKQVGLSAMLNYHYTRATNETNTANEQVIGKQLIYTPLHTFASAATVEYKGFNLSIQPQYTGRQFISPENTDWLNAYLLLNMRLEKEITMNNIGLLLFAKAENITDIDYQSIAQRPMPGRAFFGGLQFQFKR